MNGLGPRSLQHPYRVLVTLLRRINPLRPFQFTFEAFATTKNTLPYSYTYAKHRLESKSKVSSTTADEG